MAVKQGAAQESSEEYGKDSEDEECDSEEEDEKIKQNLLKVDDGEEFDSGALCQYQLERLRYYYAVITFLEKNTALMVYEATNGTEYLTSANFFDLRFTIIEETMAEAYIREKTERKARREAKAQATPARASRLMALVMRLKGRRRARRRRTSALTTRSLLLVRL